MSLQQHAPATVWADRVIESALGALDLLAFDLGLRMGWYRALAAAGPLTARELAQRTNAHPHHTQAWLEQQVASGFLEALPTDPMEFRLPDGAAEALRDPRLLARVGPLARMLAGSAAHMPALLDSLHTGRGVSRDELEIDNRLARAGLTPPWFEALLADAIRGLPDLHDALHRPGAAIADVGCGAGWSTLALADAYPEARVVGIDIDPRSIAHARSIGAESAASERVSFHAGEIADLDERFDAVFLFESLDDMPRPVDALTSIRHTLRPGGVVIVMDEDGEDADTDPMLERLRYDFSLFVCLPEGLSSRPSTTTDASMPPTALARYAAEAGFTGVTTVTLDDVGQHRFRRLDLPR